MAFKQEVNIPMIVTTGMVGGFVLVVMMLGTQAWLESSEADETIRKAAAAPKNEFVQIRDEEARKLNQWSWTDSSKTTAMIPINDAMKVIVATNGVLPATQPAPSTGSGQAGSTSSPQAGAN